MARVAISSIRDDDCVSLDEDWVECILGEAIDKDLRDYFIKSYCSENLNEELSGLYRDEVTNT